MHLDKEKIINFLKEEKQNLKKKFGVKRIALFGSYVKNKANENSDIDIAVEIESNNKFRSFFELKYFLEKKFNKKVDLAIEEYIKPIVKKHIKNELIYV